MSDEMRAGAADGSPDELLRLLAIWRVAEIDAARLVPARVQGLTPAQATNELRILPSEDVRRLQHTATRLQPIREGFSGADPYEIALRYAAGQITREQLIDELSRWEYTPDRYPPEPLDDGVILGDWSRYLSPAFHDDLIDFGTYEEIFNRCHPNRDRRDDA